MSSTRAFAKDDIAEVADLFAEVFLSGLETDMGDLRSHVEAVYFDNPFYDEDCPSLVYCDAKGDIVAFLGVTPRRMRFGEETIKTAIVGNLMVKGTKGGAGSERGPALSHGHQLAPAALIKMLFRGSQDLTLSDTAIDASRRIWERSGGVAVRLYSMSWLCILKPLSFGIGTLERRGRLRTLFKLSKPIGTLGDQVVKPFFASPDASLLDECTIDNVDPGDMVQELKQCRHYDLVPDYTEESLAWVLKMAGSRRHHGPLRAFIARDKNGKALGWAIYAGQPGQTGYLLQLYASPQTIDRVVNCLLFDAAESGIAALSGKADPLFVDAIGRGNGVLRFNAWTLARTKRPELLNPILLGKAMFSELESEGWTRFLRARPNREFSPS
jgi:hypothetical protein